MIFKLILLSALMGTSVAATESRVLDVNGNEAIFHGGQQIQDEIYGLMPTPNSEAEVIKFQKGKEILRYKYSIDSNGLRKSFSRENTNKKKHLLIFGGSQVFGENLYDDQTIAYQINERAEEYQAYPIAYLGSGPNQAWMRLQQNKLKNLVSQKKEQRLFSHMKKT